MNTRTDGGSLEAAAAYWRARADAAEAERDQALAEVAEEKERRPDLIHERDRARAEVKRLDDERLVQIGHVQYQCVLKEQAEAKLEEAQAEVTRLREALMLVKQELDSADETGDELCFSQGEREIIDAALAEQPAPVVPEKERIAQWLEKRGELLHDQGQHDDAHASIHCARLVRLIPESWEITWQPALPSRDWEAEARRLRKILHVIVTLIRESSDADAWDERALHRQALEDADAALAEQ